MRIRVYVEGGGHLRSNLNACRRGFSRYCENMGITNPRPRIIAAGDRRSAFEDFRQAVRENGDDIVLLLVDSEGEITQDTAPMRHLRDRDGWEWPAGTRDDQAHVMVQCMESWFLADRQSLAAFFGEGFLENSLPGNPNVEQVPKNVVMDSLAHASRHTQKGPYHKTRHGFRLLESIRPELVCQASSHAERFRRKLHSLQGA